MNQFKGNLTQERSIKPLPPIQEEIFMSTHSLSNLFVIQLISFSLIHYILIKKCQWFTYINISCNTRKLSASHCRRRKRNLWKPHRSLFLITAFIPHPETAIFSSTRKEHDCDTYASSCFKFKALTRARITSTR